MLAIFKHHKWKEQVKVSTCQKFGDLVLKTEISDIFKNKKYPQILKENEWSLHGIEAGRVSFALPTQNLKFSVFKNFYQCHSFQF